MRNYATLKYMASSRGTGRRRYKAYSCNYSVRKYTFLLLQRQPCTVKTQPQTFSKTKVVQFNIVPSFLTFFLFSLVSPSTSWFNSSSPLATTPSFTVIGTGLVPIEPYTTNMAGISIGRQTPCCFFLHLPLTPLLSNLGQRHNIHHRQPDFGRLRFLDARRRPGRVLRE